MRKHTAAGAAAFLGVLAATAVSPATRVAAECVTGPQGPAPAGHHWYYLSDHAKNQKCWYLKKLDATAGKRPSPRARQSAGRSDNESPVSATKHRRLDREALFEDFLRWQKQQESRR